ncbi:AcrR family transcriptional regulator [Bifidobacterium commune]|uniref:Transcriptional regulator, TetR family n=1 Tax=Bifidobacterium commune TaxID=1505727 RepID=A0A1C4H272_9BIFI|nr:helix-turn-helix domain-containing protein [Bifidobacterium commune]MBB2954936.1 AcrR family transcriptional regulator [Bifidobacterium commune]SCC79084.1 transcriptional regulator, TetR family [Bifidobacterium commune]
MARPRNFDEDIVIQQCRQVFCTYGYAATSIDDLVEATGLKRGSLYQVFGSKRGIFLEVLQSSLCVVEQIEPSGNHEPAEDEQQNKEPDSELTYDRPEQTVMPEPQTEHQGTSPIPDSTLTLAAIACLELASHDAKIRMIIDQWAAKQQELASALGSNLLKHAGIIGKP